MVKRKITTKEITKRKSRINYIFTTGDVARIALFTALLCIMGPLSIPIGPVPISMTNLGIYFALYALGWKRGTISYLVYLLLGLAGIPVFSGFSGGAGKLLGPTGGYLIGFILLAVISGFLIDIFCEKKYLCILGMVIGLIIAYIFEILWLVWQMQMGLAAAVVAGVIPFLIGDALKIALAVSLGPVIRKQLISAGLY